MEEAEEETKRRIPLEVKVAATAVNLPTKIDLKEGARFITSAQDNLILTVNVFVDDWISPLNLTRVMDNFDIDVSR